MGFFKKKKKTEKIGPYPKGHGSLHSLKDTICILIVIYITNGVPRLSADTGLSMRVVAKGTLTGNFLGRGLGAEQLQFFPPGRRGKGVPTRGNLESRARYVDVGPV